MAKHIPTNDIVLSVESVLARQRELPESSKDDIRSIIASTLQSASITDCNLTKDELHSLRRLRNDKDIVKLPADKERVTVVMDKKDYTVKMDSLVTVDFILLYRAAFPSSLESWVLAYEVANYVVN